MTVVGSNLLDIDEMDKLRTELDQSVKRVQAHPESGRDELAAIWNEMADRAEFLFQDSRSPTLDRHPRPKILPAEAGEDATAKKPIRQITRTDRGTAQPGSADHASHSSSGSCSS